MGIQVDDGNSQRAAVVVNLLSSLNGVHLSVVVVLHRLLGSRIARINVINFIDVIVRVISTRNHRHAAVCRVVVIGGKEHVAMTHESASVGSGCCCGGGCGGCSVQPGRLLLLLNYALAHVLFKCRRHREGHFAEAATVDIFTETAVRLHVARQFGALGTGVAAQFAFVGFLARVRATMYRQIGAILEDFAAILARIVAAALLLG